MKKNIITHRWKMVNKNISAIYIKPQLSAAFDDGRKEEEEKN